MKFSVSLNLAFRFPYLIESPQKCYRYFLFKNYWSETYNRLILAVYKTKIYRYAKVFETLTTSLDS
jgi:hypothetical protein